MTSYKIEFSATFDVEDEAALLGAAARHEPSGTPPNDPRSALLQYVTARLNTAIFQMEGVSPFGGSGAIMGAADDNSDAPTDGPVRSQEAESLPDKPRLHIRVLGRNEELGNWNAVGETDDGMRMPADFWGVQDIGDGIDFAAARGVELRVAEDVYADMQTYGDAWFPRPKAVRY